MKTLARAASSPLPYDAPSHDPTLRERFEVAKDHLILARKAAGLGQKPLARHELHRARFEVDVVLRTLQQAQRAFGPRSVKIPQLVHMVARLDHALEDTSKSLSSV